MKKLIILLCGALLCGCTSTSYSSVSISSDEMIETDVTDDYFISPYQLTDDQQYLLDALNLQNTFLLEFNAPEEAITAYLSVVALENGQWINKANYGLSIGSEREPVDELKGTIGIVVDENRDLDLIMNCAGRVTSHYKHDESVEYSMSYQDILSQKKDIALNTTVPVAIFVYDNGSQLNSYSLDAYENPFLLEGIDMAEMVTIQFTDAEL